MKKKAPRLSDVAARFTRRDEIRIDERHTIKLRTSRWFPEMLLLTGFLATAGTWIYGKQIGGASSFSVEAPQSSEKSSLASDIQADVSAKKEFAAAPRPKPSSNPRIIAAKTNTKAFSLDLTSAKIVGDEAVITYRIFNKGRAALAGTTWVENNAAKATQKVAWKAKNFTVKTVSVPLKSVHKNEVKIMVSSGHGKEANTYKVQF